MHAPISADGLLPTAVVEALAYVCWSVVTVRFPKLVGRLKLYNPFSGVRWNTTFREQSGKRQAPANSGGIPDFILVVVHHILVDGTCDDEVHSGKV